MHGQGLLTSPDRAKKYVGEFWENNRHGWGVLMVSGAKNAEISSFKGFYKNDLPEGLGEAEFADGSVYKGFWKNGVRHGHGIQFYPNQPSVIYIGNWTEGMLLNSSRIIHFSQIFGFRPFFLEKSRSIRTIRFRKLSFYAKSTVDCQLL